MYASQTRTASADICESRAWSVSPTRFPISVPTRCSRATSYSIRVSRAAIRSSQSICRKKGDAKKGDGAIIRLNPADPEQNRVRVHFYENCTLTLSLATSPLLKAGPEWLSLSDWSNYLRIADMGDTIFIGSSQQRGHSQLRRFNWLRRPSCRRWNSGKPYPG